MSEQCEHKGRVRRLTGYDIIPLRKGQYTTFKIGKCMECGGMVGHPPQNLELARKNGTPEVKRRLLELERQVFNRIIKSRLQRGTKVKTNSNILNAGKGNGFQLPDHMVGVEGIVLGREKGNWIHVVHIKEDAVGHLVDVYYPEVVLDVLEPPVEV